jgi:hypothetical protein
MTMRALVLMTAVAVVQLSPASAAMFCERKAENASFTCLEKYVEGVACLEDYKCASPLLCFKKFDHHINQSETQHFVSFRFVSFRFILVPGRVRRWSDLYCDVRRRHRFFFSFIFCLTLVPCDTTLALFFRLLSRSCPVFVNSLIPLGRVRRWTVL